VADNKFHCIILKGGDQYPYFPRPLLSEFDFSVPLTSAPPKDRARTGGGDEDMEDEAEDGSFKPDDDDSSESRKLGQQFVLRGIQAAQVQDLVESTTGSHAQRAALARLEVEMDKALLQLLAIECREGEERGMRALEMVELMRDRTGKMVDAAGKVAERYGRTILGEKIRELGDKKLNGMDYEDI
jgi:chromosome transmission fidelity protein 4